MSSPLESRLIRRAFGAAVDTYAEASVLQREVGRRLAERLDLLQITPGSVLDLGCGPGAELPALAERYRKARLLALDVARPMLAACPRRAPGTLGFRRPIHRVCADAAELPLADDSIDLIWSNLMFPWIADPDALFGQWARVLSEQGVVLFASLGPDTLKELREAWAEVDEGIHVHDFIDMHDIGDGLVRAGLREPVLDAERLTLTYRDVWQLMRDLQHLGARNVARARRRTLTGRRRMQAMVKIYEARHASEGGIPATCEVVYGLAWAPKPGQARRDGEGQVASFPLDQLRGSRVER